MVAAGAGAPARACGVLRRYRGGARTRRRPLLLQPRSTRFFIARRQRADLQEIRLEGNFAPEAFSTDNESLFVVQYLPAARPTRYRVRQLDLGSGEVGGVYSVEAKVQGAMRGTPRIQAMSPAGVRLYTLYTQGGQGHAYAFVHVLDLAEEWAHCVDLPAGFAAAPNQSALALSPDGSKLYVVNARAELVGGCLGFRRNRAAALHPVPTTSW